MRAVSTFLFLSRSLMKTLWHMRQGALFWFWFALYMLPTLLVGCVFFYEEDLPNTIKRIVLSYEIYTISMVLFIMFPVIEDQTGEMDCSFLIPIVFSFMAAGAFLYLLHFEHSKSISMWLAISALNMFGIVTLYSLCFSSNEDAEIAYA